MESKRKLHQRPLSPHLQIYKPQITSVLSILHRMTGVFLFFSLVLLFWFMSLLLMQHMGLAFHETNLIMVSDNIYFKTFIFFVSFCLYCHLANGIRHLLWDMGYGFSLKSVNISGILVVLFALALAVNTFIIFFWANLEL